nr:type II toxin-antitoxin system RelE/ParE family toxin [uncultured Caproiciproducens sp.]
MAICKIEILAPAWRELDEIASYHLLVVGKISAKKITDRILGALERLEEFPLSCPYIPDAELKSQEYRMLVCDKYVCIYRVIGDIVYVYHIAHGATEYGKLLK